MSDEKALVIRQTSSMSKWQELKEFGEYAARTGLGNQYDTTIKAYVAYEMGLPAYAGLNGVHVIEGKPSLAPALVWAQILKHPEFDGYEENRLVDEKGAFLGYEITLKRKNGMKVTRSFTMDDAKRIVNSKNGKTLSEKDNYKNYPENVCYWRAMGFCEDVAFADVTFGLKRADELGADITPDGYVIEQVPEIKPQPQLKPQPIVKVATLNNQAKPIMITTPAPNEPIAPVVSPPTDEIPQYGFTLQKLLESALDSDILEVMNGEFPVTPEQINTAVHLLVKAGKINVSVNQPE